MSKVDMSAAAVSARLRQVSEMSDLRPERRLDSKIDMSPQGVSRRLREASELLDLCQRLNAHRVKAGPESPQG